MEAYGMRESEDLSSRFGYGWYRCPKCGEPIKLDDCSSVCSIINSAILSKARMSEAMRYLKEGDSRDQEMMKSFKEHYDSIKLE
jgi:transcription initiation factor IIE alpha subunit